MTYKRRAFTGETQAHPDLKSLLADIVVRRAQGLLTQREYEERLEEVSYSLPQNGRLEEHDLSRGGTRFVLHEARSGRVLGQFEIHPGHADDR